MYWNSAVEQKCLQILQIDYSCIYSATRALDLRQDIVEVSALYPPLLERFFDGFAGFDVFHAFFVDLTGLFAPLCNLFY